MKTRTLASIFAVTCFFAPTVSAQTITTELIASGLSSPLDLKSPPGDARLFIAEQSGAILIMENGALLATPYFDGSSLVAFDNFTGLRAFEFHPDYANNGYVYIAYDEVPEQAGDVVVERLTVSSLDANVVDPASRVEILRVTQTEAWHGGGCMNFGSDGYFYVAFGDGFGHGFDPFCHSQDGNLLLGKMLRLDLDSAFPYAIPADNPFVGDPNMRDEIWHLGLRHPWRWSFDPANGDMWIGDVGQVTMEEIDYVPAGVGGLNFGWRTMEGTNCLGTDACDPLLPGCGDPSYTAPIFTQLTGENCSLAGGFVYRGSAMPAEQGKFFFGAYCSGGIWALEYDGNNVNSVVKRNAEFGMNILGLTAFGRDSEGEIYMIQQNGTIRKIVPFCEPASNYCPSNVNSSGTAATITMTGSAEISSNDMAIVCQQAVPNRPGLFFYGPNQITVPFGEGIRCVGGSIFRIPPPLITDGAGSATRAIDFNNSPTGGGGTGSILVGSTWNFQFWYRDPAGGPGGFNLSNGLSVSFCP